MSSCKDSSNDSYGIIAEKVDLLFEKRKAVREAALSTLLATLSFRYCGEALELRQETLADGLERVMKDLQLEPTLLALKTTSVATLSIQSGHEVFFNKFNDLTRRIINNKSLSCVVRSEAINTLAIMCFMCGEFNPDHEISTTAEVLAYLGKFIFTTESDFPQDIIRSALQGCILLGSSLPSSSVHELLYKSYFSQLVPLLDERYDITLRVTVAKAIGALIEKEQEYQKDQGEEFTEDLNTVLDLMIAVVDDKNKFKIKVDLKKQRKGIKELISYLEEGEMKQETITVRSTPVVLNTWAQRFQMDRFRAYLGEGFMNHLEENKNLMHVFDYFVDISQPIIATMTKQQRRQSLSEASKVVTKARSSLRAIKEQEVGYATE